MNIADYAKDWHYLNSRINDSIVRHVQGQPIYIHCVEKSGLVIYNDLTNNVQEKHGHNVEDVVDLTPFRLGYINMKHKSKTTFSYRLPWRQWRQGLTTNNVKFLGGAVSLISSSFCKMLLDVYPTPFQSLELVLNGEQHSSAFSKDFAVKLGDKPEETILMFRDKNVGNLTWNGVSSTPSYNLYDKNSYLKEALEDILYV